MRWPFSLLFRGDRDAAAATDVAAGGSSAPGAGSGPAPAAGAPARPAAWRGLPPVQRAVGAPPLTAGALPFSRDVAGRRTPDPILRPLAHDVTADGPAGLVSGIASPLTVPASAAPARPGPADLPAGRRVQRRGRTISTASMPPRFPEPDDPLPEAAELPAAEPRSLPAVPGPAVVPALAATRVSPATAPEAARAMAGPARGALQRDVAAEAPPLSPATVAVNTDSGADPMPRAGLAGAGSVSDAPGNDPAPSTGSTSVQRRTLGESRRLGLGAPLTSRPTARPSTAAPDLPLRGPLTPAVSTSPLVPPPSPVRIAAAAAAPLPVLRLAAPGGAAGGAGPEEAGAAVAGDADRPAAQEGDLGAPGGGSPSAGSVQRAAPLVGDPDRRPASAAAPAAAGADGGSQAPGDLPLAPVAGAAGTASDDEPGAGSASARPPAIPAGALDGGESTAAAPRSAPLVVARAILGAGTPLRSSVAAVPDAPPARRRPPRAGRGGRAGRPDPVPRPRRVRRSRSVGRAVRGTRPPRGVRNPGTRPRLRPGHRCLAWAGPAIRRGRPPARTVVIRNHVGAARAVSPGILPRRGGRRGLGRRRSGEADAAPPIPVARLADGGTSSPARVLGWTPAAGFAAMSAPEGPVVQRAVEIGEMTSEVAPPPAAPADGGAAGGQDYEEIAERVYDRIRSRFATELLLDRERMGLLIDG